MCEIGFRHIGFRRHARPLAMAAALVACAPAGVLEAQVAGDTSRAGSVRDSNATQRDAMLSGTVVQEDGKPVEQAIVRLVGAPDSALTTRDGRFALRPGHAGAYILSIRRLGFRAERYAVSVSADEDRDVTIVESRTIPVLATVTTTAQERSAYREVGFEQRKEAGLGQFLTYDQIVKRQATKFTQLLQGLRGIRLSDPAAKFGQTTADGTRGIGSCVSYVVDGVPQGQLNDRDVLGHSLGPESPDNFIAEQEVAAIEVYSSAERPAGLGSTYNAPPPEPADGQQAVRMDQQCVLVVVWTKGRLRLPTRTAEGSTAPMDVAASDATLGQPVFGGDPRCPPPPAQDTTDLVLYATVEGSPPGPMPDTAWSGYKGRVLAALDRVAALPTELALPAFGIPFPLRGGGSARGRLAIAPTLSNVVGFTLDGRGALTSARVAASSLSPDADTTSLAMIQAAALAHSFPALPSGPGLADSVQLYLQIASIEPRPGTRAALLGQLEVPTWPLTRRATLPEDRPTAPPSPSGQRAASVDSITAEFVVDPAGHPAMNTVRIVGGRSVVNEGHSPPASVARFLQTLPVVQYEPALIGACRVPELVIQSFALPNAGGL